MTDFLHQRIQDRITSQSLRVLSSENDLIDFCSNDYLGLSRNPNIQQKLLQYLGKDSLLLGATGSRLISGNFAQTEELERRIASFHGAGSGLIFNSGYDANVGLLSSIPRKGDTIICDELVHASIIDGCRLSLANKFNFRHNDLNDLEVKLKNAKGNIFVVTESIFSMDGDSAPLAGIVNLCEQYGASLIVDEAHATGVFGNRGEGMLCALNLQDRVFARVITFGKAVGSHGAIVLGSQTLRTFLTNFARSFIYTTALPPHSIFQIAAAYDELEVHHYQKIIQKKISLFREGTKDSAFISSHSTIQCLVIPGNGPCKALAQTLRDAGFDVRAILHPTVAKGAERLRICLHTFNSDEEIHSLCNTLKRAL